MFLSSFKASLSCFQQQSLQTVSFDALSLSQLNSSDALLFFSGGVLCCPISKWCHAVCYVCGASRMDQIDQIDQTDQMDSIFLHSNLTC